MDEKKVQTGIEGLDEIFHGGFPKGSMILVAGNPGTGKTMLSGQFLHHGAAECSENGLYVSFSEGRSIFLENMRKIGRDFKELENRGRFDVLDLITVKEPGIDAVMELITTRMDAGGVERLVIDSFTAMSNAFSTAIDARVILHLLSKILRRAGCTTLLVAEMPTGRESIGMGIEEFVVDGVIILRRHLHDGYTIRKLEIAKMRGTRIEEPRRIFTLHEGLRILTPLRPDDIIDKPRRLTQIPKPPNRFSTGHMRLDEILGGFGRGDTILIERGEDIPAIVPALMFDTLRANFLKCGMGVFYLPPAGLNVARIIRFGELYGVTEEEQKRLLRIAVNGTEEKEALHILVFDPDDPAGTLNLWKETKSKLREATGKPTLSLAYIDRIISSIPPKGALRVLERVATTTKNEGGLLLLFSGPGPKELIRSASNLSEQHFKLMNEQGVILFHGIRPRTPLYALETNGSEEFAELKMTPLV